jgi:fatty acid desaturase
VWLLAAIVMARYPSPAVRIGGVLCIGVCIQAFGILMHEALHGNLFRQPSKDRWACFLLGIPTFFSGSAYKAAHLNHHRHTRTAKDHDELSTLCRTGPQLVALFYGWFLFGTFIYMAVVPWKALSLSRPQGRHRILLEYAAMFGLYGIVATACLFTGHLSWLLWYWLIPAQIAVLLSNIRGLSEHLGTDCDSALLNTRTTTSNRLVSFLMLNLNYHLEHHLYPGIPWYNLRKAHVLLGNLYANEGAYVQKSYINYALQAIRSGPFRKIPGRNG